MTILCEVCCEKISKYKCSTCCCPYCSVCCWKAHKNENTCQAKAALKECYSDNEELPNLDKNKYFTEDTVPEEKLRQLGNNEKLKNILKNKYLRNVLIAVNNTLNPEETLRFAMKDPEFVEFVDECLKIVEDSND